jgi:hypothetical protein
MAGTVAGISYSPAHRVLTTFAFLDILPCHVIIRIYKNANKDKK